MIKEKDIEKMSIPERLKAIELIWESISEETEEIESPKWHGDILEERQKKANSGEAKYLTISEVRERLQKKADEESNYP